MNLIARIESAFLHIHGSRVHVSPNNYKALEREMDAHKARFAYDTPCVRSTTTLMVLGHEVIADDSIGDNELVVKCDLL